MPPAIPGLGARRLLAAVAVALLALLFGNGARAATAPAGFDFDTTPGSLSKQVVPLHYALQLALDPSAERFSGRARIELRVRREVEQIVLHAHQLEPGPLELRAANGRLRPLVLEADPAARAWRLKPRDGRWIAPGRHALQLAWQGKVERTGQGLFGVDYALPGGASARMLATQLEPHHARRVFPCFDEPSFRATFSLEATAPRGFEVLSNTPLLHRRAAGADGTRWQFARTPSMPSYLFAVAVGRFEKLQETIDGVRVAVVSTAGKREQGRFALAALRDLLPYFRRYFDAAYPLSKLDLLAVPGVRNGAMEDWGLISFEESVLLLDARESAQQRRERVYGFIAHEVAHQWFGNLVTAAWWDEIWLNEAFATWIAAKTSAHFNARWRLDETRRLWQLDALARDGTPATRAIRSGPVSEDAVFDVFDDITYAKGGAVLSMLEDWIGPERFRAGLAAYMRERRYSNATAGDLWRHLGKAAGRDLQAVVSSWTDQPGYPLIDAARECRDGRTVLTLSQSPFRLSEFARPQTWRVPLRIRHGEQRRFVLLDGASARIDWSGCDDAPLLVNAGDVGFYRVRYAAGESARLLDRLGELPAADRPMLLDDALALAQAGAQPIAPYLRALSRLPALPAGAAHALALQAVEGIDFIDESLEPGSAARASFASFARSALAPLLQRLGWRTAADEDALATRLRPALIERLARLGDEAVRAQAAALTRAALRGGAPIEPTIREAVLGAAAAGADAELLDLLIDALRAETREERRWELARALGAVQSPALAERVLQLALDPQLPASKVGRLPSWLSQQGRQPGPAFDFAVRNFDALARRSAEWGRIWILPGAAGGAANASVAAALRDEQQRRAGDAGRATAELIAARIELKARFREREAAAIAQALRAAGG